MLELGESKVRSRSPQHSKAPFQGSVQNPEPTSLDESLYLILLELDGPNFSSTSLSGRANPASSDPRTAPSRSPSSATLYCGGCSERPSPGSDKKRQEINRPAKDRLERKMEQAMAVLSEMQSDYQRRRAQKHTILTMTSLKVLP